MPVGFSTHQPSLCVNPLIRFRRRLSGERQPPQIEGSVPRDRTHLKSQMQIPGSHLRFQPSDYSSESPGALLGFNNWMEWLRELGETLPYVS